MKFRIYTVVLFSLIFIALFAFPALAENEAGDTVSIPIIIENHGASYIKLRVDYPEDIFEYVAMTGRGIINNGTMVMVSLDEISDGTVGSVTLRALNDIPCGTYTVSFIVDEAWDLSEHSVQVGVQSADLTICGEHIPGPYVTETPATCTSDGLKRCYCTGCGQLLYTRVIKSEGHTEGAWQTVTEPTYENTGLKKQYCQVCGVLLETRVIPKFTPDHIVKRGREVTIPLTITTSDACILSFTVNYDTNAFELVSISCLPSGTVLNNGIVITENTVIPSGEVALVTLRAKTNAMLGIYDITTVTGICYGSDMGAANAVINSPTVRIIEQSDDVLHIPALLTEISEEAFAGVGAAHIVIPSSVISIGARAFAGCSGLTRIDIPSSVTSIAPDAFSGSSSAVIYTTAGSYAYQYAVSNNIAYIISG